MELIKASRSRSTIKMALQGPSGSGKTFGALLLAFGLERDWERIAVIDTENNSSHLYAHLGGFSVLTLTAPYNPEKYVEAIHTCEKAGKNVIIVDSMSHEWQGLGGIMDMHSKMTGNSFTNWNTLTPRHNLLIQALIQSRSHIICTIRTKQDYVLVEKNKKVVPEKVGLKAITREGLDYEMTVVFDLDLKHNARASKDRTGLFMDKPEFRITPKIGEAIKKWCGQSTHPMESDFSKRINDCTTLSELSKLYYGSPELQETHNAVFQERKSVLQSINK